MVKSKTPLATDDPRHGSNAGYVAGCGCTPCREARLRHQKAHRLALHRGKQSFYSNAEVRQVIDPWLLLGLSPAAIQKAAGLGGDKAMILTKPVRWDTYQALANVTEDDFADGSFVHADLTRRRIYSLQAAGHRLIDMPINPRGFWRTRPRLTVGTARAIRAHFADLEMVLGPSRHTASRALNAGHVPPLAWDDPGTLAWPTGKPERIIRGPLRPRKEDVDPMVVARILAGEFMLPATQAERRAVVAEFKRLGRPIKPLEDAGWRPANYTTRKNGAA